MVLSAGACMGGTGPGSAKHNNTAGLSAAPLSVWKAEAGEGFNKGAKEFGVSLGAGIGMPVLGSHYHHDWALGAMQYGWMLSDVRSQDSWLRGNWEVAGELLCGAQFHPDTAYLIGAEPLLRYNFAAGRGWVPFIELGAGVAATGIRNGDLSSTFEFSLQGGAGTHLFLRDNLALTFRYRFIHISNACLETPNQGVNNSTFLIGLTRFF